MKLSALLLATCTVAQAVIPDFGGDILVDANNSDYSDGHEDIIPETQGTNTATDGFVPPMEIEVIPYDDNNGKGYNVLLEFSEHSTTGSGRRLMIDDVNEELARTADYNKLLPSRKKGLQGSSETLFNEYTVPTLIQKYFNGAFVSMYDSSAIPELRDEKNIRTVESLNGIGMFIVNFETKEDADDFFNRHASDPAFSLLEHEQLHYASIPNFEPHPAPQAPGTGDIHGLKEHDEVDPFNPFEPVDIDDVQQEVVGAADEFIPNDTLFSKLWGFKNSNGIDMKVTKMWKKFPPESSLSDPIVAVLDSGTDVDHPDLKDRLWVNWAEYYGKPGVDDDGNGYVDDVNGFNFITMTPNINEQVNSHGTHTAGSALASGNNAEGVVGGFYTSRLMTAQMLDSNGNGPSGATARAINYVTANGAQIASCSWTGGYSSTTDRILQNSPVLFVCASGNGARSIDTDPRYPAGYTSTHDNVLSIGAAHSNGNIASFSNFGRVNVDVFAPGTYITSTCIGGNYCTASGTSMATPNASGIAAALFAKGMTMAKAVGAPSSQVGPFSADVKKIMVDTATEYPLLVGKARANGLINASDALDSMTELMQSRLDAIKKDCVVGAWGNWSTCTASCGATGTQTRTRTLVQPQYGGAACPAASETQSCKGSACATDCSIGDWSQWSACDATCGTGKQTRTRTVTQPTNGGKACPSNTLTTDTRTCTGKACPVNCKVSDWSAWGSCSVTCGTGSQTRTRTIVTPASNGGTACPTELKQTQTCKEDACTCTYGDWSDWSTCSTSCTTQRSRSAQTSNCSKKQVQVKTCSGGSCKK